jgi:hypothetical protein
MTSVFTTLEMKTHCPQETIETETPHTQHTERGHINNSVDLHPHRKTLEGSPPHDPAPVATLTQEHLTTFTISDGKYQADTPVNDNDIADDTSSEMIGISLVEEKERAESSPEKPKREESKYPTDMIEYTGRDSRCDTDKTAPKMKSDDTSLKIVGKIQRRERHTGKGHWETIQLKTPPYSRATPTQK